MLNYESQICFRTFNIHIECGLENFCKPGPFDHRITRGPSVYIRIHIYVCYKQALHNTRKPFKSLRNIAFIMLTCISLFLAFTPPRRTLFQEHHLRTAPAAAHRPQASYSRLFCLATLLVLQALCWRESCC